MVSNATETVQLRFNQKNLSKNLRYAFTNTTTVASELMQNARRAGATFVAFDCDLASNTLVVSDDGSGIDNFQKLFTIAESGWPETLVDEEHCFGLGFASALYAAEHILVESQGRQLSFSTKDALNFDDLKCSVGAITTGTRLTLRGLDVHAIKINLPTIAEGFAIPVYLDGAPLPRPFALDGGLSFERCEFGHARILGIDGDSPKSVGTTGVRVYLQGLFVCKQPPYYSDTDTNVIHLDPHTYLARLPDRTSLIDQELCIARIRTVISQRWREHLTTLKSRLPAEQFANDCFEALRRWNSVDLLNDVPYLPQKVLGLVNGYPVKTYEWQDRFDWPTDSINREDVITHRVSLVSIDSGDGEPMPWMYMWYGEYIHIERNMLDGAHWVHPYITDISNCEAKVNNISECVNYRSNWLYDLEVIFCDSFTIQGPIGEITVTSHAMLANDFVKEGVTSDVIIVPRDETDGRVVRQCVRFLDENDDYLEDEEDKEIRDFARFIRAHVKRDPLVLMKDLLSDIEFDKYELLRRKRFVIEFDDTLRMAIVA